MISRKLKNYVSQRPFVWKAAKQAQAIQYDLNYLRFYSKVGSQKASTTEIGLEFCSACNLRCKYCALDHLKPKQYMSITVLNTIMDALLTDERFSRVKKLNLYNGGETLLHPKRLELFMQLKEYKQKFLAIGKSFPKVVLLTNGMLLRKELSRQILELDVVDEVGFSLDGGSPKAFEEFRVNAKWEKFANNVAEFTLLKRLYNPKVKTFGISIVPEPHPLSDAWMHPSFKKITAMLDEVEYRRLHDWGGEVDVQSTKTVNKKGCAMLLRQLVILPNGDVSVCCNDLNSKGVVGNVLVNPLYTIYKSKARLHYVSMLQKGQKHQLELCKNCVSF